MTNEFDEISETVFNYIPRNSSEILKNIVDSYVKFEFTGDIVDFIKYLTTRLNDKIGYPIPIIVYEEFKLSQKIMIIEFEDEDGEMRKITLQHSK